MQSTATREIKTFLAMIPAELEVRLRAEAKAQHRSRNAQLVTILKERYMASASPKVTTSTERAIQRLHDLKTKHRVRRIEGNLYAVISGRSGNEYLVDVVAKKCACAAGSFRMYCDHILSAETLALAIEQQRHQHTSSPETPRVVAETRYERGGQRVTVHTCEGMEV